MLIAGSLALVLWTVYLGWRLPQRYVSDDWRLAWIGLDVIEIVGLLLTTWAAYRRRIVLIIFASATATAVLLDAWFDVTTARSGDLRDSVLSALFVEIPGTLFLYFVAGLSLRRLVTTWYRDPITGEVPSSWAVEIPHSHPGLETLDPLN